LNGFSVRVGYSDKWTDNAVCDGSVSTPKGAAPGSKAVNCDGKTGKYVHIVISGKKSTLTLCEVKVYGQLDGLSEVSYSKTATQSSDYSGGVAGRAVDGNTNSRFSGRSCTHTQSTDKPWWMVDLGSFYDVQQVIVFNRGDCCQSRLSSFAVRVGNNPDRWDAEANAKCGETHDAKTKATLHVACSMSKTSGRFVYVTKLDRGYLTLCEVKVIGKKSIFQPVSQNKPTKQSSTDFGASSARAVDGNTEGDFKHESCTHTKKTLYAWWRVDLQRSYSIKDVIVYNRSDCCGERLSKFKVYVGQKETSSGWKVVHSLSSMNNGVHIKNRHGRCLDTEGGQDKRGGQIQSVDCDNRVSNQNQVWSYNSRTGSIKPRFGTKCMVQSTGNLNFWDCSRGDSKQRWLYNPQSGQIKHTDSNKCLDAYDGKNHGLLTVSTCDVKDKHQQFDLARYNYAWRDGNVQCGDNHSIALGKSKSISCRERAGRYVWIISSKDDALTLCEVSVIASPVSLTHTSKPTPPPTPVVYGPLSPAPKTIPGWEVPKGGFAGCAMSVPKALAKGVRSSILEVGKSVAYMTCMMRTLYASEKQNALQGVQCKAIDLKERAKLYVDGNRYT